MIAAGTSTWICFFQGAPGGDVVALQDGFWHRAGKLRASILARKRKARLGDALIAQCCIDADNPLITRDANFQAFSEHLNLL